jgi:signal peptidase
VLGALIGIVLLVAAATLPVLFGYHTYVVNGGSMGSALKAGSVAVSKPTSPYDLDIGDIIARRESPDSQPVLHRIVGISVEDGQRVFVTQGDVNQTPDSQPVALDGPGDKVVFSVPYAGYILRYAGSGLGRLLLIGAPLALLAVIVLREKWRPPGQGKGTGTGTAAEDRGEAPPVLDITPPPEEEEALREAAAVLLEPPRPWRGAALPLMLVPLAIALGVVSAERNNGSWGRHQPMRVP